MSALLEVNSVTVSYGRGPVVRDLSLKVDTGDVLGIVGESGCGKTTLAWTILGLLPAYARVSGSVVFEGQDLLRLSHGERRRVLGDRLCTIPQSAMASLDPMYAIGDQITEIIRTHRPLSRAGARDLVVRSLREVGLPSPETRIHAYPHELSGGTRQRVAIAAALALRPSLLIADEPTSALDVTIQAQVLDLLRVLIQQQAGAVILITHDLGVVAQLCSRVAVLYAGEVVEESDVASLFADPKHPYTQRLLAAHPAVMHSGERLATIPGSVPDPAHRPPGCPFQPRCPVSLPICEQPPPWVPLGERRHVRCVHYGEDQEPA